VDIADREEAWAGTNAMIVNYISPLVEVREKRGAKANTQIEKDAGRG